MIDYLQHRAYTVTALSRGDISKTVSGISNQINWANLSVTHLQGIDTVIHLAGKAHDLKNTSDTDEYFKVNLGLTRQLFDVFLLSNAKLFIYFSSVKAAADRVEGVLDEGVIPAPKTAYGKSKLAAEQYLLSKPLPNGKRLLILRPCMIHGPDNKGNLNLLFNVIKKGIPYPLAAFKNTRSFLSIENCCFMIEQLLKADTVPTGVYQLADDAGISTLETVKLIASTIGLKARLINIPPGFIHLFSKAGDIFRLPFNSERLEKLTENYLVSNHKIKKALGIHYLPVPIAEGLKKTIKSFIPHG